MTSPFRLEALESTHDRSTFTSGEAQLDLYFKTQVTQDIRRRIANCFVAVDATTNQVAAYYTIASASISTPDYRLKMQNVCLVILQCLLFASVV